MAQKKDFSGKLHWLHWVVVFSSLILTVGAWKISKDQIEEKIQSQFDRESAQVVELIFERIQKYEDGLWGGVSAIGANGGEMNYQEWATFAKSLRIDTKYPGINGIGVILHVLPKDLQSYIALQKEQRPFFKIHPTRSGAEYLPITYIEPAGPNANAVGLDMAHETNRYLAAKKARETGRAQITAPITLVQDKDKTPGFLFYAPYYKNGIYQSVEDRKKNFLGMVYAPFVFNKLMEGVLQKEKRHVGIKILDGKEVLYSEHDSKHEQYDPDPLFIKKAQLKLYGRTWEFDIRANKDFRGAASNSQPLIILFGGITIDALLLLLFMALVRSNRKALAYAQHMNDEAEEQRHIAIYSSKLASLGEMAGGVAHEINNPLSIIAALMMKMRNAIKKGDWGELSEMVNQAENTVFRISKIIRGMKAISRDGSSDPMEKAVVEFILQDALGVCTERFKNSGVSLKVNNPNKDLMILCRRVEVSQVLVNLLNNAFDAVRDLRSSWVEVNVFENDTKIYIEVVDSGKGIPTSDLKKILDPFFTTKRVGEGTGLGLSISKTLIEKHNGSICVDEKSENTKFIIELPIDGGREQMEAA